MQPKVHCSIIYNNQDMEATQVSTNRQMDKEDVYVYMYAYEGERGECKSWLKLTIQKTKIMASGPITFWQTDGETMETVTHFIFLGSKITADGDYSHEIKTLAPSKKSYDQPRQRIKKQRHYSANKGPSSQSYGISSSHVWM